LRLLREIALTISETIPAQDQQWPQANFDLKPWSNKWETLPLREKSLPLFWCNDAEQIGALEMDRSVCDIIPAPGVLYLYITT
jgi:hypothetical protein